MLRSMTALIDPLRTALVRACAWFCVLSFAGVFPSALNAADDSLASAEGIEFFEKHVRPLLAEHCYECHSVDAKRVEASLLLDSLQGHLKGGDSGPAIVSGDPNSSLLIEAVRFESYEMPPKGKLPDEDIKVLVQWIEMGTPWPDEPAPTADGALEKFDLEERKSEFWVWQPIVDPEPPAVANTTWPRTAIDQFILTKLEAAGLEPAPDADPRAILRRIYLDLIGLPPTPEDIEQFVNDASPNALERVVDRLLESKHFGERWGRHWLDLVRYAESRGHEFDNDTPNAFQYRDYVIRALNADVPYDQFVREHIAGDLLSDPRMNPSENFNESVLGTGFWFLGEWVHSPVDVRKDESDRFDNMIDVMSKTFLGVTVACARCHDHKFDAISTADYYSLSGFLQSSDYRQVRFESMETNRKVAEELEQLDHGYRAQLQDLLDDCGIRPPASESSQIDPRVVVDYGNLAQSQYMQDGFVFGAEPRRAGQLYFAHNDGHQDFGQVKDASDTGSMETGSMTTGSMDSIEFATYDAATSDPFWSGLESITEGSVHNSSKLAKLPRSGRTLRTPTFDLTHGSVHCMVEGAGHVVACVDSHRLVAGPLHGETVVKIDPARKWVKLDLHRYVGHRIHLEFTPDEDTRLSVRFVAQGLKSQDLTEIEERLAHRDKSFEHYAEKARSILNTETHLQYEEQVFADFESGTYDGWTVTGEAFGQYPQTLESIADYQGEINAIGSYFVNSHNVRQVGNGTDGKLGDNLTGTLTSDVFRIDFDTIQFWVGGGNHEGKTCVNLVVDGNVVLSTTGQADNQMELANWDVRPFAGKSAKIEIVDNHTSGWGNIGVDHIVFRKLIQSDSSGPASESEADDKIASSLKSIRQSARQIVQDWTKTREALAQRVVRKSRVAPAMMDGTSEDDHILIRGSSSNPGRREPRHFLTAISSSEPLAIQGGSGRLELANHINDPRNPLTSRVVVNRMWHHLMGRGIVPTVDDFGFLGQRPTHPQLLDHLATRFLRDGQSLKRTIKYIVLSRSYQMSGRADPEALEIDPTNRLWHYLPPRRLQAEAIRDSLLAISGRLDSRPFGPPVPIHLTPFMQGRGRPAESGPVDGAGRRSIYVAVRRNFLSPFMLTFDTPVPFSSMGRRNVSNVPAQALILLNDPLVAELAADWGAVAREKFPWDAGQEESKWMNQRITWLYESGFARLPTSQEIEAATSYLESQSEKREVDIDDPQLWGSLAHALVNAKEFIFLR